MNGSAQAGINRVWWDLRYDAPTVVKLRTSLPDEPWVKNGTDGYRLMNLWTHYRSPAVAPGTYTVKLDVDGNTSTQTLPVLRDPNTLDAEQDIQTLLKLQQQIRSEVNDDGDLINHIEWTRRQIEDLEPMLAADPKCADLVPAAKSLDEAEVAAERKMMDVEMTGRNEDQFRNPIGLYGRLTDLGERVDMSADLPSTNSDIEVNQLLQQELAQARQALNELETKTVPNSTPSSNRGNWQWLSSPQPVRSRCGRAEAHAASLRFISLPALASGPFPLSYSLNDQAVSPPSTCSVAPVM